jgi:GrpB-like predicted nucleotidyltransferase (UPF0157 family)
VAEPVVIVEHDPEWSGTFERLRGGIAEVVGDVARSIEHVGSTAVPGLAAKPIIDLDVVVRGSRDVPEAIRRLATLGYRHEGDKGVPRREAFKSPSDEPRHHLYVVVDDSPAYRRHVWIRDYLRAHPNEARAYGELKRRLAEAHRDDRAAYTAAKDEFTDRIYQRVARSSSKGG